MTHTAGPCGSRLCTDCGPAARAVAIEIERAANTTPDPAPPATPEPPATARVELSVFGRGVTVEAPEPLAAVAAVAERLWTQLAAVPAAVPVGAAGFVASDPDGFGPPAEMSGRVVGPYRDWEVRHAA